MSRELDELYFEWLSSQVASVKRRDPSHSYNEILWMIFKKEFIWYVANDDNRIADGIELRDEFLDEKGIDCVPREWIEEGCSMLEIMIVLSRMLTFEDGHSPRKWFWELMHNIGLADYNDSVPIPRRLVNDSLDQIIWRTYDRNGHGGFFPLRNPRNDQREVELWYQLNAYLIENL